MNELENRLKQLFGVTDWAAQDIAKELDGIVRKQIASEIDVDAMVKKRITVRSAYRKGIEDTLKMIKGE